MIKRVLLLIVLFLIVLLVVADRLTEQAAAHALAVKARQTGLLAADPTVTIRGFPFLTQAVRGRYTEIDVETHGIHRGGLRLDTVIGRFRGVHVGLSAALNGRVSSVPIDHATGEVDVIYADLDAFLAARHITVRPDGTNLVVSGSASVLGVTVTVSGPVTVRVSDGSLSLVPDISGLRGPKGLLPTAVARTVSSRFTTQVTLNDLPFGLALQSVTVGPAHLTITASAQNLTVPVPPDASQTPSS
jgi:hypothetical protein